MLLAVVEQVECVAGCDKGGGVDPLTLILSGIGLVVAVVSAGLAWVAKGASQQSADAAKASLGIAEEQHRVFMTERQAHADFELEISLPHYPTDLVESSDGMIRLVWRLEVTNTGDKAATHVSVHFYAPLEIEELAWVRGESDSLASQQAGPFEREDSYELRTSDGVDHPTQFLTKIVDRVGRRGSPRFSYVSGYVSMPKVAGEERQIPVELMAFSDDMEKGAPMRRATYEATVRRVE
jgi:hypothetical protein